MEKEQTQKTIKPEIKSIAISCNTFLRPELLEKNLESIAALNIPDGIEIKVLVVDNDKNASAKPVIEKLQNTYPYKINYFVEKERGLSSARNRLLQEAINLEVTHVAILDDDDIADENWIKNLVDLYNTQENAYIVSGPEFCCFEEDFPKYLTNNNIFVKKTSKKKGEVRIVCSTHNAFFPLTIVKDEGIWFDRSFVFMGGEDGDFFYRAGKAGYTIVFTPDAIVRELNGKDRVNIKWILSRNYYNGYSGSYLQYKDKSKRLKRFLYLLKMLLVCFTNLLITPLTLVCGLTVFFNMLGLLCKNFGKLMGAIKLQPLNYYEHLNGGINK